MQLMRMQSESARQVRTCLPIDGRSRPPHYGAGYRRQYSPSAGRRRIVPGGNRPGKSCAACALLLPSNQRGDPFAVIYAEALQLLQARTPRPAGGSLPGQHQSDRTGSPLRVGPDTGASSLSPRRSIGHTCLQSGPRGAPQLTLSPRNVLDTLRTDTPGEGYRIRKRTVARAVRRAVYRTLRDVEPCGSALRQAQGSEPGTRLNGCNGWYGVRPSSRDPAVFRGPAAPFRSRSGDHTRW
jgi:hypothetical protein